MKKLGYLQIALLVLFLAVSKPCWAGSNVPNDLWVLPHDSQRPAEMVLAQTLQGLTGRERPKLWLEHGGMSAVILGQLEKEGTSIHRVSSVWNLPADNVHAWSFGTIGGPMEAIKRTIDLLRRIRAS
jgi:hypothetical protein